MANAKVKPCINKKTWKHEYTLLTVKQLNRSLTLYQQIVHSWRCYGIILNSLRKFSLITSAKSKINMTGPHFFHFYYYISRFQYNLNSIKVVATQRTLRKNSIINRELTLYLWLFCCFINIKIVFTTIIWTK
jgi:hypothetical protein